MKLHYKIMLSISFLVVVVVAFISLVVNRQTNATLENQIGYAASDMAITIATLSDVGQALVEKRQDDSIQLKMASVQKSTRYQYVIVMDMEGIQYSYPYPSGLYKPYKNGGEDKVLKEGVGYTSVDTNEIISAIRAFEPIYYEGQQVGAVLVGLLTDQVYSENEIHKNTMEITLIVSIIIGMCMAVVLSLNIKKSLFGLEPKEISLLLSERNIIIHSIERGIVAMDQKGKIILSNKKASLLLNIPEDITNLNMKDISFIVFHQMVTAMGNGMDFMNKQLILENDHRLMMSLCVMRDSNEAVIGVVAGLEELTHVRALAEELTNYQMLVDSLRAQNHEFMNKLQTISGLLQLEEFEEALDYIDEVSRKNLKLHHLLTESIGDGKISGLLLSKYNDCMEKKIELVIDEDTMVKRLPRKIESDEIVTILGNLIENSMEALIGQDKAQILIKLVSDDDHLDLIVHNNGPEIEEEQVEKIFSKGYSTKGDHRGYGLYLIKKLVDRLQGDLSMINEEGVTWHVKIT